MKNINMKITGDKLTIEVDLSKNFGKSKSGKSVVVASTNGNIVLAYKDSMKLGLNLYKPD